MRKTAEIVARDELGRKQCVRCQQWHPTSDFYSAPRSADRLRAFCRFCSAKEDSVKRHHLGLAAYEALIEKQGGCCAICKTDSPAPDSMWTIDHDHNCCSGTYSCGACVRGLICRKCNMALGLLNESPETVRNAVTYLESYYG